MKRFINLLPSNKNIKSFINLFPSNKNQMVAGPWGSMWACVGPSGPFCNNRSGHGLLGCEEKFGPFCQKEKKQGKGGDWKDFPS